MSLPGFNGHDAPKTLILCFDGTANHFDGENTNVVKLFECLKKDDHKQQLCYYQPGVGTYLKPGVTTHWLEGAAKALDQAVAWYLDAHVMDGYQFIMRNYHPGDRICLFGFSRGAYIARALAGFLFKAGLLPRDNYEQVTFAYRLYKRTDPKGKKLCDRFRRSFCQEVKVEFVGVWDTVASVGMLRSKTLPFTAANQGIKTFRHALALDEHRVKFKPSLYHRLTPLERELWKQRQRGSPEGAMEKIARQLHLTPDREHNQLHLDSHHSHRGYEQLHLASDSSGGANALGLDGMGMSNHTGVVRVDSKGNSSKLNPPRPSIDSGIAEVTRRSGESDRLRVPGSPPVQVHSPPSESGASSSFHTPPASAHSNATFHVPEPSTRTEDDLGLGITFEVPRPSAESEGYERPSVGHEPRPSTDTGATLIQRSLRNSRKLKKKRRISTQSDIEIQASKDTPDAPMALSKPIETDVLEVWFAGCHSDVGGGATPDDEPSLSDITLRWMIREVMAAQCGVLFDTPTLRRMKIPLDGVFAASPRHAPSRELELDEQDAYHKIHDEMKNMPLAPMWWIAEFLPFKHLWQDGDGSWHKKSTPNIFQGRKIPDIKPNFHISVRERIEKLGYKPKARWKQGTEVYVE